MYTDLIEEYQGQFAHGRSVEDLVGLADELPPMPDAVARAIRLVDNPDATTEEIADAIMLDPTLAWPILRFANSAQHGQQQEVTTMPVAVQVVGLARVRTILITSALRRWNRAFGPVERLVWDKSLGAASSAFILCGRLKKNYRDELYLTGLLHNLGQIVLLSHREIRAMYPAVLARIAKHHEDFVTAEREVIGFSHPLVGALVARKWELPFGTCQAILHYPEPFEGICGLEDEKLALLKLSVGLGLAAGLGKPEGHPVSVNTVEVEKLAAAVGFDPSLLQADFNVSLEETKSHFASESQTYG
jgi:HD-like signal output (HDOD) protein